MTSSHQRFVPTILSFFLIICFSLFPRDLSAVQDPELIAWRSTDLGTYINSAFLGVLGRNPNNEEFRILMQLQNATLKNKADLFWRLVGTVEYENRFGYLDKVYWVYWDTKRYEDERGVVTLCRCYYFSKDRYVFMPTMQYIGIHCPSGPFNFGVASAVRNMYAAFDAETCTLYECGYRDNPDQDPYTSSMDYDACVQKYCPGCANSITLLGVSADPECTSCLERYKSEIAACAGSTTTASTGVNLVEDANFENFGFNQSRWNQGNNSWGNSGYNRSTAQKVDLPMSSRPRPDIHTALMIQNYSGRGPHVYGTTHQKIRVNRGRTYKISLWAAAENLASNSGVLLSVDSQWRIRPIRLRAGTYGWTEYTGSFTATEDFVYLRIIAEDQGKVYLSGITLQEEYY